ncbi:MAG: hypothetical protein IIT39_04475 [Clostridia bacterium]|nr:hypothetical protein [Clostridia bacterium]
MNISPSSTSRPQRLNAVYFTLSKINSLNCSLMVSSSSSASIVLSDCLASNSAKYPDNLSSTVFSAKSEIAFSIE